MAGQTKQQIRRELAESGNAGKNYLDLSEKADDHIFMMVIDTDHYTHPHYLDISDDRYLAPTGDQVKEVISIIMSMGYNKPSIARLLGVSPTKNRTLDRWTKEDGESSKIPYAAWRLLLAYSGKGITLKLEETKK